MSKYIIELDDRIKLVASVGVTENGVVYTTSDYVHNLEELNSDYINEHYGELQDEAYKMGINDGSLDVKQRVEGAYQRGLAEGKKAFDLLEAERDAEYQRGFEDGKKSTEKGCEGCKYEHVDEGSDPCCICAKGYIDRYEPATPSDRIEVGDEVINNTTGTKGILLEPETEDLLATVVVPNHRWNTFNMSHINLTKTGRHFDIEGILEAMKNG